MAWFSQALAGWSSAGATAQSQQGVSQGYSREHRPGSTGSRRVGQRRHRPVARGRLGVGRAASPTMRPATATVPPPTTSGRRISAPTTASSGWVPSAPAMVRGDPGSRLFSPWLRRYSPENEHYVPDGITAHLFRKSTSHPIKPYCFLVQLSGSFPALPSLVPGIFQASASFKPPPDAPGAAGVTCRIPGRAPPHRPSARRPACVQQPRGGQDLRTAYALEPSVMPAGNRCDAGTGTSWIPLSGNSTISADPPGAGFVGRQRAPGKKIAERSKNSGSDYVYT